MNFLQNGNEVSVFGSYQNLWSLGCMAGIINTQSYGLAMDLYSFTISINKSTLYIVSKACHDTEVIYSLHAVVYLKQVISEVN